MNSLSDHFAIFALVQASQDKKSLDVGANLFVGNLDPVSQTADSNPTNIWHGCSLFNIRISSYC